MPEEAPETPAENLDAILSKELDAITEPPVEEIPAEEMASGEVGSEEFALTEEIPQEEIASEEIPIDEIALTEMVEENIEGEDTTMGDVAVEGINEKELYLDEFNDDDANQTPEEFDMAQAAEALTGEVDDLKNFLDGEEFEYTEIKTEQKIIILIKAENGHSMAIIYECDDFDEIVFNYEKDGKTSYRDITNSFVKELICAGACSGIKRHKGTKVVISKD